MNSPPRVSVAMSVYNGAAHLPATMRSILEQEDCDFELVVVDDGSRDDSLTVLEGFAAKDSRIRLLRQENAGLTQALARACAEARGEYIARHDAGDRSLPGRFKAQVTLLDANPDAVMTGCGVRFVGPRNEPLHEVAHPMEELDAGLRRLELGRLSGPPHHGATMFRRRDYESVGGYRLPFVVAQDIDLWLRLAERGRCLGSAEIHYEAMLEAGSISGRRRAEQFRLGGLAVACARARRAGEDEGVLLRASEAAPIQRPHAPTRAERARFNYFLGSCLRGSDPRAAREYFREALRDDPLHLRALLRCLLG